MLGPHLGPSSRRQTQGVLGERPRSTARVVRSRRSRREGQRLILVGTMVDLYRSTDGGETWGASGIPGVITMQVTPGGTIVVLAYDRSIRMSDDSARSWRTMKTPAEAPIFGMLYACSDNHLLAGTEARGVFVSVDSGRSWKQTGFPGVLVTSFARVGNVYLVTTAVDGLFRSTDGGLSWKPLSSDYPCVVGTMCWDSGRVRRHVDLSIDRPR